jgi:hypothetical protein
MRGSERNDSLGQQVFMVWRNSVSRLTTKTLLIVASDQSSDPLLDLDAVA